MILEQLYCMYYNTIPKSALKGITVVCSHLDQGFEDIYAWYTIHNHLYSLVEQCFVDSSYSILLGRPWLMGAKVAHDQGNNMITIQGNGIIMTITMIKHLGTYLKRPKVLLCFDYYNGITYEDKDLMFTSMNLSCFLLVQSIYL
jgi:hypothetical protein